MKRILSVLLVLLMLSGCTIKQKEPVYDTSKDWAIEMKTDVSQPQSEVTTQTVPNQLEQYTEPLSETTVASVPTTQAVQSFSVNQEIRAIWCAIYELAPEGNTEKDYINQISTMMNNIASMGLTDVFVQVRANGDSIYPSSYYAPNTKFSYDGKLYFDALKIILEIGHSRNLKIHAWINPYRLCADRTTIPLNVPSALSKDDIYDTGKSVYIKPTSTKGQKLVEDGVREILTNYQVDGIHIDDYFYPTTDEAIDKNEYDAFVNQGGTLSLTQYRKGQVSFLVSSLYSIVKSFGQDKIFSISPQGNVDNNLNSLYADVESWCSQTGYCDIIIPQIYFGFYNNAQPFASCLNRWIGLCNNGHVRLIIGLAIYKAGKEDSYAGTGSTEWLSFSDIIKRQVECIRSCNIKGFALFSYHYVFGNDAAVLKERENLKSIL